MPNRPTTALSALAGIVASSVALAGPLDRTLYAIADHTPDPGTGILVAFDPDNPSDSVLVGNTNVTGLVFLTYDPRNDFFIASTVDTFFKVNKNTGNATPFPVTTGASRLAGHTYVQSRDQMLVAYSLPGDSGFDRRIGEINADGSISPLLDFTGDLGGFDEFDEIIWNPETQKLIAFCTQGAAHFEIDLDLGTISGPTLFGDGQSLAGGDRNPENDQLYLVDRVPQGFSNPFDVPPDVFTRNAGDLALSGNPGLIATPIDDVNGLAFIPTPGAAALLGLGGLTLARRRR